MKNYLPRISFTVILLVCSFVPVIAATININTSISGTQPINICSSSTNLTTAFSFSGPGTAPTGSITQTLPVHCTLNVSPNPCPGVQVSVNNNIVTYSFTNILSIGFTCSVTGTLVIPCSVEPVANSLDITYSSGSYTLNLSPSNFNFQVSIPEMNIVDFNYDGGTTIPLNHEQLLLVSPNHYRQFDLLASYGVIESLNLNYSAESEINAISFVLQGYPYNGVSNNVTIPISLPSNPVFPYTIPITQNMIIQLFGVNHLGFGDRIRVKEYFNVFQCSPALNDSTHYVIDWNCPILGATCNKDSIDQRILVRTSTGGINPGFSINPPLDICGASASDMILTFSSTAHDAGLMTGSNMKSLHTIEFSMNQQFFTMSGIFFEGQGSANSVDVTTIPNFYSYDPVLKKVILNFDALTTQVLGSSGPLQNGFIPETPTPIFNELEESKWIRIRFKDAVFHCQNSTFYSGRDFDDCRTGGEYMFFGKDVNDRFKFYFDDMCHSNTQPSLWEFGNYNAAFPITGLAEANKTDLISNESALINFIYQYTGGGATPSPFSYVAAYSGNPYFTCTNTYQATITIPNLYTLNGVYYNPDPNVGIGTPIAYGNPIPSGNNNIYIISGIGYNGRITTDVTLSNCPQFDGDFDTFTAQIQAVCNSCTACAYTVSCFKTKLFHHCQGYCANPGATPPQSTAKPFKFERKSFGWTDATMQTPITSTSPNISINRAYNCDEIDVTCAGTVAGGIANKLSFLMTFENDPLSSFQYFEFVSGTLNYTVNGNPRPPITLTNYHTSTVFNTSNHAWINSCAQCSLWVNFPDTVIIALDSSNQTENLNIHFTLRVKPMDVTPAAGFYNLPQIRGQYYSDFGISCDSWGDNMTVLNVRVTKSFNIRDAMDANSSLGWSYNTGVCNRHFLFYTNVSGGLTALDDFPYEFRPIIRWPDSMRMTLPSTIHFNYADFSVSDGSSYNWHSINTTGTNPIVFKTFNDNGIQHWPLLDKNGQAINLYIRGTLTNDCPAAQNNPIGATSLEFPFISKYYSTGTGCYVTNPSPETLTYPLIPYTPTNYTPVILLSGINPVHVTSSIFNLPTINFSLTAWGSSSIENAWIRPQSSNMQVQEVHVNNGPAIFADANGYFQIGTIYNGAANTAHLTLKVQLNNCVPGTVFKDTIHYGYSCVSYPTTFPPTQSCISQKYVFDVAPDPSNLVMNVDTPSVTTGIACNSYTYVVHLTSTQNAEVESPLLKVQMPSGMTITSAQFQTNLGATGSLNPIPNGNGYTLDVNNDVYQNQGMPKTPAFVNITITVTGNCSLSGTNPQLSFIASGKNVCGANLVPGPPAFNHSLHFTPQNLSAAVSASINPVSSCTEPLHFTINLNSLSFNSTATAYIHSYYDPSFTFSQSNYAVQSGTPSGTTDWIINLPNTNPVTITCDLIIPNGYCGPFPLVVEVDLHDGATCCTMQYTVTSNENVCCNTENRFCMYVIEGGNPEQANQVIKTTDGGIAIAGSMYECPEDVNLYLLKYKSDMSMDFNREFGDWTSNGTKIMYNEMATSVVQSCDFYYLTGYVEMSPNDTDIVVAKFKHDGTLAWCRRYGHSGNNVGTKIITSPVNGCEELIITGYSSNPSNNNDYNAFVLKLNPGNGTQIAYKEYGSLNYPEKAFDIKKLDDGKGYVLTGTIYRNNFDILTISIDNNLNLINNIIVGGDKDDLASGIIETRDYFYVAGESNSFSLNADKDVYLVKLEKALNLVSAATYGNSDYDETAHSISLIDENNIMLAGSAFRNDYDALLMQVNLNENNLILWSAKSTLIDKNDEFLSFIKKDNNSGDIISVGLYEVAPSDKEIFIAQTNNAGLNCCMAEYPMQQSSGGISERYCESYSSSFKDERHAVTGKYYKEEFICTDKETRQYSLKGINSSTEITVFPNPNQGVFEMQLDQNTEIKLIRVYDIVGKEIQADQITINKNSVSVNLGNASNGIYYLKVTDSLNDQFLVKVVVNK